MSLARIDFSPQTEGVITQLGSWLLFVAVMHFIFGVLMLLASCAAGAGSVQMFEAQSALAGIFIVATALVYLGFAVLLIVEGTMLVQARTAFRSVALTDSNDQAQLVVAFRKLRVFFLMEAVVFGFSTLWTIVGFVIGLFAPEIAGSLFDFNANQTGGGF